MLRSSSAIHLLLSIVLLFLFTSSVITQNSKPDLYSEVPVSIRASFVKRLDLMIEAMRTERYEKVYALLSRYYTRDESKEVFIRRLRKYYSEGDKFISFVPEGVGSNAEQGKEPTQFIVTGCLKMREKGRKINVNASVSVYAEDGGAYFSVLGPMRTLDGKYISCSEN